jgi:hypothetical protein
MLDGKAYAIFYCSAPGSEILGALARAKGEAGASLDLEFFLNRGTASIQYNPALTKVAGLVEEEMRAAAEQAEKDERPFVNGNLYVLGASYSFPLTSIPRLLLPLSRPGRLAIEELESIMDHAYVSDLFEDGERFDGRIVDEKGKQYTRSAY